MRLLCGRQNKVRRRLLRHRAIQVAVVGWGIGVGMSLIGADLSYQWDLPTGAAIVCTFGITLLLVALVKRVVNVA